MDRIKRSTTRNLILTCLTIGGIVSSAAVNAECTDSNTCFGIGAMQQLVDGTENSAFGFEALGSDVSGAGNTAIGARALSKNIGQGFQCDYLECATGDGNTAVGASALATNRRRQWEYRSRYIGAR